jgi:hypothetical protein
MLNDVFNRPSSQQAGLSVDKTQWKKQNRCFYITRECPYIHNGKLFLCGTINFDDQYFRLTEVLQKVMTVLGLITIHPK